MCLISCLNSFKGKLNKLVPCCVYCPTCLVPKLAASLEPPIEKKPAEVVCQGGRRRVNVQSFSLGLFGSAWCIGWLVLKKQPLARSYNDDIIKGEGLTEGDVG